MKSWFAFSVFMFLAIGLVAQPVLFTNNGADIYVKDGGLMIVKTGSVENLSIAGNGVLNNAGTIIVEGSITNNSAIQGLSDTIRLSGDWINHNAYSGAASWVEMNGATQQITGNAVTTFSNLNLLGGNVVKRQTIDSKTTELLILNNAELATDLFEMHVTNPATIAITRNNGFVSSVNTGKLSRNTNSVSPYFFPTGSPSYINGPSLFRPIEIMPSSASSNTYGAMVVKGNATNDGYDVTLMDDQLCKVNPNFYHQLYHSNGNDAASLTMFYDAATDGNWTDIAHWDQPNQWNYTSSSTNGNNLGFSTVSVSGISDFTPQPFALARKRFTVNAGSDVAISPGESTLLNPTVSGTGSYTFSWTPSYAISCQTCESTAANPTVTTSYILNVSDADGCSSTDDITITVLASDFDLLVPTAFSPNNDGVNDVFRVLNKNISRLNFQIYNRWGEKVFETSDLREGWDGMYQGVEQEMGVYVWMCQYTFAGTTKSKVAKGNMTLVR